MGINLRHLLKKTTIEETEIMKKMDAKCIAYLANESTYNGQINKTLERATQRDADMEFSQRKMASMTSSSSRHSVPLYIPDNITHEKKLEMFKTIRCLKLEMEALALQPNGTKCMELLETEIRPIFTIECQLSNELIKNVKHSEMFHVMQFESEKFNNMTQCTRFGQYAQREVKLMLDEGENAKLNFGSICFTVWWREPGTCLNEMLGIGSLNLMELYYASLVEQCKRIKILRRGCHMASVYFKITLQREMMAVNGNNSSCFTVGENKLYKANIRNSNDVSGIAEAKYAPKLGTSNNCSSNMSNMNNDHNIINSTPNTTSTNATLASTCDNYHSGEYAEEFLYLKHTKIE